MRNLLALVLLMVSPTTVFAAHPLITDDSGTQGKGNFQVEVNAEWSREKESVDGISTRETTFDTGIIASVGITDAVDLVFVAPYQWITVKEDDAEPQRESGLSDASMEVKWRFHERDGWGFALKPGLTLPTGDEEKGLGAGKATYSMFFISTREIDPWAFHLNIGYLRNENTAEERKDLWHASLASEVEIATGLKAVANLGMERTPDPASNVHPAFFLAGLIYSITENFDIDFGAKVGMNAPEADLAILSGIAWRF